MRLNFDEEHAFWLVPQRPPEPPSLTPILPVKLTSGLRSVDTYAVLDSGADTCLFHADWARNIGIVVESGRWENRTGIDPRNPLVCYCHTIDLTVGSQTVSCEVAFSDGLSPMIEDQLIGRQDVFDALRFALRQGVQKAYIGASP